MALHYATAKSRQQALLKWMRQSPRIPQCKRFLKMFLPPSSGSVILSLARLRTLDRAFSSGGERFPDTEEVRSSNLLTPTKCSQLRGFASELFCFTPPSQADAAAPKAASTTPATTPTKPTVAQTVLATASIGLGWASISHPDNLPIVRSNTFPRSERAYLGPRSMHTF